MIPEATSYDAAKQAAEAQGTPLKVSAVVWCHWGQANGRAASHCLGVHPPSAKGDSWPAFLRRSCCLPLGRTPVGNTTLAR